MADVNRRDFVKTLPLGLAAFDSFRAPAAATADKGKQPNILYIMADDHSANAISAYGSRVNQTPNIDRLAQGGMRFDNCFCTNSICTPSRAAILTGQYSHINGVKTLADKIDPKHENVAKDLQAAGYQTAIIGKWHLATDPSGFDYWNILPGQGVYHDPVLIEMGTRKKHAGYATDIITGLSLDWLKARDKSKPFFLMCHHKAPHRPWEPDDKHMNLYTGKIPEPDNLLDKYEHRSKAAANATNKVGQNMNKTDTKVDPPPGLDYAGLRRWAYQRYLQDYLRCVASVDDNVGRVLDYLDSEKLAGQTLVIYTSDQGMFLGEHGFFDKRFMYEESLRMPFLIRYPGEIKPKSVNRDIVLNIDFASMFLDFAGQPTPKEMQGRSFRPLLEGHTPKDWRKAMYYRYWMHLADHGVPAHYGIRTARYKLVYYYGKPLGSAGAKPQETPPEWELFDLEKDPHEMNSVYGDPRYATIQKQLTDEMYRLQKDCGDSPA
jgi:arylsulfatase A-like enzyme